MEMQMASQRDKGSCYLIQRETHSTNEEGRSPRQTDLFIPDHRHLGICRHMESWTQWRRLHVCSGGRGGGGGDCFRISVLMIHNMHVLTPVLSEEP